ncbi:MAG: GNAT family N-acetyltransferase [Tatlockia sp.]|nr:GNAT family N-acetyltransferase [Tatlockia sp.]
MTYPYLRKAEARDYTAIWSLWMQDHIIQWMSFPKQTKEEFRAHYSTMEKSSDIYVLVDKINNEEKIVAVRRIKYGKNHYQHTAEYCSMGVDKALQGKGYGKILYQEFEKIAREQGIKRIQLTQSGGNEAAFHLADKHYSEEGVFPDWLERSSNEGKYFLIERYIYRFLDEEMTSIASKLPKLKYQEKIPMLIEVEDTSITISRVDNQFICYLQQQPLLKVGFEPDDSVIQHIGFLSLEMLTPDNLFQAQIGLRKILTNIFEESRVKKLELFTAQPAVAELCKNSGFFKRAEKIASFCENKEYKNELGVEYSFFNISDAKKLITAAVSDCSKKESIEKALDMCSDTIKSLVENKICDFLGAHYLENLVYQMVRDDLGPNKIFSLTDKRWKPLLTDTPLGLQTDLLRLANRLNNSGPSFFNNKSQAQLESPDQTLKYKI